MIRKFREKKVKDLMSNDSSFDRKNKLNRSTKRVQKKILDSIENEGVTIEFLDGLKLPVFKYKTQVTIHGMFPKLEENYSFGYKSLVQNKNKSIGVRWSAIDEGKRQRIARAFKDTNIRYQRSSTKNLFYVIEDFTEENFEEKLKEMKELYKKFDNKLFYGKKSMYIMKSFFGTHIYIDVDIKGIYEHNVQKLIDKVLS